MICLHLLVFQSKSRKRDKIKLCYKIKTTIIAKICFHFQLIPASFSNFMYLLIKEKSVGTSVGITTVWGVHSERMINDCPLLTASLVWLTSNPCYNLFTVRKHFTFRFFFFCITFVLFTLFVMFTFRVFTLRTFWRSVGQDLIQH